MPRADFISEISVYDVGIAIQALSKSPWCERLRVRVPFTSETDVRMRRSPLDALLQPLFLLVVQSLQEGLAFVLTLRSAVRTLA